MHNLISTKNEEKNLFQIVRNCNPGQNIWHKVNKYSKIGQDYKNLKSDFVCFLTAFVKV